MDKISSVKKLIVPEFIIASLTAEIEIRSFWKIVKKKRYTMKTYSGHRRIPDIVLIEVQAAYDKSRKK